MILVYVQMSTFKNQEKSYLKKRVTLKKLQIFFSSRTGFLKAVHVDPWERIKKRPPNR